MDNRLKYGILIVAGGVGIYIIWKGGYFQQWFPSLFGPSTPAPPTTPGGKPTCGPGQTLVNWPGANAECMDNSKVPFGGGSAPPNPLPPAPHPPAPNYPPVGTQSIVNGATYQADGKGGWVLVKAAPSSSCPPGQTLTSSGTCIPTPSTNPPNYCDTNTLGWSYQNGQCARTPAQTTQLISQQMVNLAGNSDGLSLDEWCYEYTAVTGQQCPFDPGNILPQEFNDAGVLNVDGSAGDRTTPTSIDTWLAFVNLKVPGSGISGLAGLVALHVANAWLT